MAIHMVIDEFHLLICYVISLKEIIEVRVIYWSVCSFPVMTDSHFFPSVMHTPLHSWSEGRSGHLLVLQLHQFLSMLLLRLVKTIFGKVFQRHIFIVTVVRHRQVDTGSIYSTPR